MNGKLSQVGIHELNVSRINNHANEPKPLNELMHSCQSLVATERSKLLGSTSSLACQGSAPSGAHG